jgi:glycosyltransferase involved in cell wall biosynthesis
MADRRLLLVHALAPPQGGGTPIVLRRLLSVLPGWRLEVLTDLALRGRVRRGDGPPLEGRYRYFPRLGSWSGALPGPLRPLAGLADVALAVGAGLRVAWAARRADVVLSVFDDGFSPIAAAIGARLARRPHVVMVFDLWEENAYGVVPRLEARLLEGRLLRSAAAVVVYCEAAAEHYRAKHGVGCEVIATPIELAGEPRFEPPAAPAEVLVAGAVYWAQEDAVRRLLHAAAAVDQVSVTMIGDEHALRARGLEADRYEPQLSGEEFNRRVLESDLLFVGLSLHSPHPEVILTATPARLAEYMASGRPLLVHAPAGSHAAEYARREDFAAVVDEADYAALSRGLRTVLESPDLAIERARRARRLAVERHDASRVAAELRRVLDRVAG